MSIWRERGFVQDSDEEDDTDSIPCSPPRLEPTQPGADIQNIDGFQSSSQAPKKDGAKLEHVSIEVSLPHVPNKVPSSLPETNNAVDSDSELSELGNDDVDELERAIYDRGPWNASRGVTHTNSVPQERSTRAALSPSVVIFTTAPILERTQDGISERSDDRLGYEQGHDLDAVDNEVIQQAYGRTFRRRNPIQLHPYLLEGERYRQTLKSRGLRPVLLASGFSAPRSESNTMETQEQDFQPQEDTPPSSPVRGELTSREKPTPIPASSHEDPLSPSYFALDDDDELPDVESLIRRRIPNGIQNGSKRRKLGHKYGNKLRVPQKDSRTPVSKSISVAKDSVEDIYDIPFSPSCASQLQSSPVKFVARPFRMPDELTPTGLPTPITSSATRPTIQQTIDSESESDAPLRSVLRSRTRLLRHPPIVIESSSNSDSSNSDSEKGDASLRQVQKKIKGVLPASWLKLDREAQLKRQNLSNPQRQRHLSPENSEPRRGVAQRVNRPLTTTTRDSPSEDQSDQIHATSNGSDESESAPIVDEAELPHFIESRSPDRDFGVGSTGMHVTVDDVIEDNRIDYMLPSTSRPRASGGKQRKRQLTLADSLEMSGKRLKVSNASRHARDRARQTPANHQRLKGRISLPNNPRKAKPKPPQLSILDSHQIQSEHTDVVPPFIRLAARQARRQRNGGRQSLGRKFLRLQTHQDTEDANLALIQWKAGHLKPRTDTTQSSSHPIARQPLMDRVVNLQQRQLPDPLPKQSDLDSALPRATSSTKMRSKPISNMRQTRLDPVSISKASSRVMRLANSSVVRTPSNHVHHTQKLFRPPPHRNALLEGLEAEFDLSHRKLAFQRQLARANLQFSNQSTNPQLSRFLADEDGPILPLDPESEKGSNDASRIILPRPLQLRERAARKRPSRHVDTGTREYRQPSTPLPVFINSQSFETSQADSSNSVLEGLGPFGTRYTENFDVLPFDLGTYFHHTTFIGSGELDSCLHIGQRKLDLQVSHQCLINLSRDLWCNAWTEEVSSTLSTEMNDLCNKLDHVTTRESPDTSIRLLSSMSNLVRQVLSYFSSSLYFLDPVDRIWFVTTMSEAVERTYNAVSSTSDVLMLDQEPVMSASLGSEKARTLSTLLVLAAQLIQVAGNQPIEEATRLKLETTIRLMSTALISITIRQGYDELRTFQDDSRRLQVREAGIKEEKVYVQCLVIAIQTLGCLSLPGLSFWDVVNSIILPDIATISQVAQFERVWSSTFMVLPLTEFDANGVLRVGRRFVQTTESWGFIEALLHRLLSLYPTTSRGHNSSLNNYIRASLNRCCILISNWGWKKCEGILRVIFDFFSKEKLALLRHEESQGSPKFLGMLADHPSLQIQPDDRSFTIFLKCLAIGIKGMEGVYPDKKIRSIVYRFIPNHGRTYRKEESVRQEDLDALRNHHDILCTLYWASPPQCRPRLDLIRDLVDHTFSHREACRLSVRAWADLMKFQLSTGEAYEQLLPFASWYKDIMGQSIKQYHMARIEAEAQFENAERQGNGEMSQEVLQSTIRRNQNQVLATLRDAAAGLKNAIKYAKDERTFTTFLRDALVVENVALFDASNSRTNDVVMETLAVFEHQANHWRAKKVDKITLDYSEESQDYGEIPDFDDVYGLMSDMNPQIDNTNPLDFIHSALWQLLSNCFGAEISPGDLMLTKAVDTWTAIAQWQVDLGKRNWVDFVGSFSPISWHQLRDTEHSRKFAAYFISSVIGSDITAYQDCKQEFIGIWIVSLVERESMLKFQHVLTSALVNADHQHPLLRNLPFLRESQSRTVVITIATLRERRLGLISALLANIRDYYESLMRDNSKELVKTRELATLLKNLMAAMKRNYLDLQQGGSQMRGAYVEFVQTVVQFLQQYTSHICPVDKFFTDPVTFPLPTTDPKYVVGQLGSYSLRLADSGTTKKLSMFIQTVSERAAIESEQPFLFKQLCTASADAYESGEGSRPTLRHVLLRDIFPVYIEVSLKSACGWIVATPVLQACSQIFQDLFYQFSVTDESSVRSSLGMITTTLNVFHQASQPLIDHPGLLDQAYVRHIIALIFQALTAMLPLLDYIRTTTGAADDLLPFLQYFKGFGIFISGRTVASQDVPLAPYIDCDIPDDLVSPSKLREFCAKELGKAMTENWARVGGSYFLVRGNARKEVLMQLGTSQDEGQKMTRAIEVFSEALERATGVGEGRERHRARRATNIII